MSSITISNLTKSFKHNGEDKVVIDNLNLKVEQGEFLVILGASGSGKSTLLRLISGLASQDSGHIFFDDNRMDEVSSGDRDVGMVFQSYALYPHLTVFENIAFGIRYRDKYTADKIKTQVQDIASTLELDGMLAYYPKQLSGGQQQRVAIGRALIVKPKVLLFDEPLSNLDALLRTKLRLKIADYQRLYRSTMIYVTHDQQEAMALADKIVVMNKGKVEQVGTPRVLYEKPNTHFVAGFLGTPPMNFLPATVKTVNDTLVVTIANQLITMDRSVTGDTDNKIEDGPVILGIRPEHLSIDVAGLIRGSVESIDYLGTDSTAHVNIGQGHNLIQVKLNQQQTFSIGDEILLNMLPSRIHLFDESGQSLFTSQLE